MPTLYLVRGLPGSGKSTYVRNKLASYCYEDPLNSILYNHFEADQFFETLKGYKWNRILLSQAHEWCYLNTLQTLYSGKNVYVSNTFTTDSELQKYIDLQNIIPNLRIKIVEMHTQYESIHDVPQETIERMRKRWFEIPDDWDIPVTKITE